jgi:nucleoside-diphosphate-sugar epimerase
MSSRIVVTGGAGFLGALLARQLLDEPVVLGGAPPAPVAELVLIDLVAPPADVRADGRVRFVTGQLISALDELGEVDAVFHLAGVVSGAAEADFDLGMHTNIDGTRAVLEYGRRHAAPPLVVFSSSLAVFGSDPAIGPVGDVDDDTLPRPQSSYGIQKFIGEQLVADYTRKGFVRGRSVRLMTVSVRPGRPNAAASCPGSSANLSPASAPAARSTRTRPWHCRRRGARSRGSCARPRSTTPRGAAGPP